MLYKIEHHENLIDYFYYNLKDKKPKEKKRIRSRQRQKKGESHSILEKIKQLIHEIQKKVSLRDELFMAAMYVTKSTK